MKKPARRLGSILQDDNEPGPDYYLTEINDRVHMYGGGQWQVGHEIYPWGGIYMMWSSIKATGRKITLTTVHPDKVPVTHFFKVQ